MKINEELVIKKPIRFLFDLLHDYDRRLEWDPFLSEAKIICGKVGIGCVVRCTEKKLGLSMDTEYVSFKPPKLAAIRMIQGPRFLDTFTGTWLLEELSQSETRIKFHYNVVGKPNFISYLLAPLFRHESRRRLKALDKFASSVQSGI